MDRKGNSLEDLDAALADIALVNRWLGGSRALVVSARPYLRAPSGGGPLEILDVGTGGADLPLALLREARAMGVAARVSAVELDPVTAALAARAASGRPDLYVFRADAMRLPFRDRSFDLVCASLFLHHFDEDEAVRVLVDLARACRGALIVNDLERHRVPWAFIAAAACLTRRHPMFVHDAPLSVLRGFTPAELESVALRAGLVDVRVRPRWPYRLVLTARPPRSARVPA
jgi:2-polyprenyl-3-methyl-5-hydroxy-6-metoxy-1,4-benzoquinol methylase